MNRRCNIVGSQSWFRSWRPITVVERRVWLLRNPYPRDITNQDAGKLDGSPDYVSPALKVGTTDVTVEDREDVNPPKVVDHLTPAVVGEVGIKKNFVCNDMNGEVI